MSKELDWELPGQQPEGIRWRVIIAIVVVTLAIFGGAVAIEVGMARSSARATAQIHAVPAALGQARINLVNQLPYDLDVSGYRQRREQLDALESWGWVDRARGLVHEPIDRAMDEVVRAHGGGAGGGSP